MVLCVMPVIDERKRKKTISKSIYLAEKDGLVLAAYGIIVIADLIIRNVCVLYVVQIKRRIFEWVIRACTRRAICYLYNNKTLATRVKRQQCFREKYIIIILYYGDSGDNYYYTFARIIIIIYRFYCTPAECIILRIYYNHINSFDSPANIMCVYLPNCSVALLRYKMFIPNCA